MIKLSTPVSIGRGGFDISHANSILLLGSCFADAMGLRLKDCGFDVLCNPFGTLYNPFSIANAAGYEGDIANVVFHYDGVWHSWLHHSRFSSVGRDECVRRCVESMRIMKEFMRRCDTVVITLGSAFVYQLGSESRLANGHTAGMVVANCHKVPAKEFVRRRLSVSECVEVLSGEEYGRLFGGRRVLLTVSPIRHLADGAHQNQLSKSTLLLAVDEFVSANPATEYFPAYEIMNDELRDYRFYGRDLSHPSDVAEDIVFQRFADTYFNESTNQRCRTAEKQRAAALHRNIMG